MACLFNENPPKIYLKNSDKARLAEYRVRIVKDTFASEPCYNEDLVFEKVEDGGSVPDDALMSWYFAPLDIQFFTTRERCIKMVSKNPDNWTQDALNEFAKIEKRIYTDWCNGNVYGFIVEKWDAKRREWMTCSSLWGLYGSKDLMDNLATETDGVSIPICIDDESMKYDFDNTEKKVNEFQ